MPLQKTISDKFPGDNSPKSFLFHYSMRIFFREPMKDSPVSINSSFKRDNFAKYFSNVGRFSDKFPNRILRKAFSRQYLEKGTLWKYC